MKVTLRTPIPPPVLPRVSPSRAGLVSVVVGLLIAIGELDNLLAQLLDRGLTWSVTRLSGPTGWDDKVTGWQFFRDRAPEVDGRAGEWLAAYGVTDCLFALCYTVLLVSWLVRTTPPGRTRLVGVALLLAGGLVDVAENVQISLGAPWPQLLVATSAAKWLLLVPALLLVLWRGRHELGRWLRLAPGALYTHRYSALIVLPLGLLGLGRGPDLLEQVPDIERAWADPGGFRDFVWAGLVMGVLVVAVFVIGRQRTSHLWLRTCTGLGRLAPDEQCTDPECPYHSVPATDRRPLLAIWLLGPLVLALGVALVDIAGGPVSWPRLARFSLLPLAIGGLSLLLRLRRTSLRRPVRAPVSRERFDAAAYLGDLLVGLLPVIGGLGAIRAFTAVLALEGSEPLPLFLYTLGWLTLVGAWWGLAMLVRSAAAAVRTERYADPGRLDRLLALLTPGVLTVGRRQWLAWTVLLVAGVSLVLVGTHPVPMAERVGVIATFQLALGSLSILIAALVILFQPGGAPEVFWKVRLAFVPVTTLLVVAGLLVARAGTGEDVHGIRALPDQTEQTSAELLASRPTVPSLFTAWLSSGQDCAATLPGSAGMKVRPMLLYAAEGGGIRAAYWTTSAIDRLAATSDPGVPPVCRSGFVSSGASGGSVGLSIASVRDPGDAGSAVTAIAGPEALGAAADGLVLRDTIFAAMGLPLPSLHDPRTSDADWSDRATLIEQAWEARIDELGAAYLRPHARDSWDWGPTGALVLNSTSTTTACRALISQLRLPGASTTECAPGQPAAGSTDLLECTGQLRTMTAALLTARFPYVTPSGVVTCPGRNGDGTQQIVDGGYAENTGIGTLMDLAPRVLAEVRRHNACVLEPAQTGCVGEPAVDTLVVPQLVYFDNGTGSDLVRTPGGPDLEILVPPVTALSAKRSLYSARSQLERAQAVLATDQLWPASADGSEAVAAAVDEWRDNPVAVVYQATKPAIAAPLGWVLSQTSMDTMDAALCAQDPVERLDAGSATAPEEPSQFGTIDDVLALLPGRSAGCLE